MLRIRLSRTGKIRQPSYRVVVAEKESKRDGRIVENIGHYNPLPNPAEYKINEDHALYWLSVGAQPSDAVRILLEKQGTMGRLARLHGGESLEALVAEYSGIEPVVAKAAEAEAVVEAVAEEAADVVDAIADVAEEAAATLAAADEEE